jgi:hypothetical protein
MEAGEFLVFFTLVIATLLVFLMLTNAHKRRLDFKLRKLELEAQAKAPLAAPRDDRADLIEDRVRVLERIATDRGQDIAHQIESLRERQLEQRSATK